MAHAATIFGVTMGAVGCIAKKIKFKGKAAHAGGSPWDGVNALYAATCGLNAINAIRETFEEKDIIRVHPIITNGGAMVNAIPESATLESYVRGATFEGIAKSNKKVNRAICGAALSLGANVDISDFTGYAPLVNDKNLIDVAAEAAKLSLPNIKFTIDKIINSGSTDMGDLSSIMPVVHPNIMGVEGMSHGSDFYVSDPVTACIGGTKFHLAMLYLLMSNDAKRAKMVIEQSKPPFASKKEYFNFAESFEISGDRITYSNNDRVEININ